MLRKQYSRYASMTLTRTTQILFIVNRCYTNHHDAEACGDRDHTPCQRSYMNSKPMMMDVVIANARQQITYTKTTRIHSTNTKSIWTTEAGGDTCTPIQEMRDSTWTPTRGRKLVRGLQLHPTKLVIYPRRSLPRMVRDDSSSTIHLRWGRGILDQST